MFPCLPLGGGAHDRRPYRSFVDHVGPILQKRGIARTQYARHTLRDHFGLPRPPAPSEIVLSGISVAAMRLHRGDGGEPD